MEHLHDPGGAFVSHHLCQEAEHQGRAVAFFFLILVLNLFA